uniref:Uncharacterized protein n=1 Tax=Dendroctonus ponderosae TaxID=77166 RepID=A0AAR5Q485_DENPD
MQDMAGNTASPSDSLKKFIESWIVEEDPAGEASQLDANMNIREKLRDDAPAGTVYMINANDVHYFENNGIPIVTSDSGGFQLTSDNLCLVKGGLLDNTGVVRLIEGGKEIALDSSDNQERIVNLQIMEAPKSDCMVASKQLKPAEESRKVVIHQNTVLNPRPAPQPDQNPPPPSLEDSLSITKELVDKNCSPINLEQLEENLGFDAPEEPSNCQSEDSDDNPNKSPGSKSMPIIDFFGEAAISKAEGPDGEEEVKREVAEEGNSEAAEPNPDKEVKEEAIESVKDSACEVEIKTEPPTKEPKEDSEPRPEKRSRIFSVDDIMNNIGHSARAGGNGASPLELTQSFIDKEVEFSSLEQLQPIKAEVKPEVHVVEDEPSSSIVKVAGSSTVLQVAGELMEITVEMVEGKKIIKVKPLSSSATIIDVNANYEQPIEPAGGDEDEVSGRSPSPAPVGEVLEAPASPVAEEDPPPVDPTLGQPMEETPSVAEAEPTVEENHTFPAEAGSDSVAEPPAAAGEENVAEPAPAFEVASDADRASPSESHEGAEEPAETLLAGEEGEEPPLGFAQFEEEPLHFAMEDEVFIEDPPAHEVIVSDPLEGLGMIEEILLEPVTTSELDAVPKIEPEPADPELDTKDTVTIKAAKLEVQILSPTSTNFEDFASHRPNVYCKGARKCSSDNDVADYTVATKAAKKLYDYDLQVQHDIVSSSKKEELPKSKKAAPKRPVRLTEKTQTTTEQKEALKQLVEKRKRREEERPKETRQEAAPPAALQPERDEEYVDFKELLRARKLKKLKKMQEASGDGERPVGGAAEPQPREEEPKAPQLPERAEVKLREQCSSSTASVSKAPVLVPSISELMEENNATANKRKISLADYVNRKRKASSADAEQPKKPRLEPEEAKPKPGRTLSDMKTSFVIHSSDWEDSHSPQPAPLEAKAEPVRDDFSALISNPVVDINELTPVKNREDRTLQEYKNKVESQLSSLNIQIPKAKPQTSGRSPAFRPPHSSDLVKRFLNNEKLSEKEMEKIRKIISYKRSIQDRRQIRTPSESATESSFDGSPCSTYEVKNSSRIETNPSEVRLHIKKVNSKRKPAFGQPRQDLSAQKGQKKAVGYSVINRLGQDGMPKIVFKRHKKSLAKEPVVELVKLNLNDLVSVQEEYNVTVSQNM